MYLMADVRPVESGVLFMLLEVVGVVVAVEQVVCVPHLANLQLGIIKHKDHPLATGLGLFVLGVRRGWLQTPASYSCH